MYQIPPFRETGIIPKMYTIPHTLMPAATLHTLIQAQIHLNLPSFSLTLTSLHLAIYEPKSAFKTL